MWAEMNKKLKEQKLELGPERWAGFREDFKIKRHMTNGEKNFVKVCK